MDNDLFSSPEWLECIERARAAQAERDQLAEEQRQAREERCSTKRFKVRGTPEEIEELEALLARNYTDRVNPHAADARKLVRGLRHTHRLWLVRWGDGSVSLVGADDEKQLFNSVDHEPVVVKPCDTPVNIRWDVQFKSDDHEVEPVPSRDDESLDQHLSTERSKSAVLSDVSSMLVPNVDERRARAACCDTLVVDRDGVACAFAHRALLVQRCEGLRGCVAPRAAATPCDEAPFQLVLPVGRRGARLLLRWLYTGAVAFEPDDDAARSHHGLSREDVERARASADARVAAPRPCAVAIWQFLF